MHGGDDMAHGCHIAWITYDAIAYKIEAYFKSMIFYFLCINPPF